MFKVILLEGFFKKATKTLSRKELEEVDNIIEFDLKFKGDTSGDPLSYHFLREKKVGTKRLYYLVYKDINLILVVDISNKKAQKETIQRIKDLLSEFKRYVYNLFK